MKKVMTKAEEKKILSQRRKLINKAIKESGILETMKELRQSTRELIASLSELQKMRRKMSKQERDAFDKRIGYKKLLRDMYINLA